MFKIILLPTKGATRVSVFKSTEREKNFSETESPTDSHMFPGCNPVSSTQSQFITFDKMVVASP